MGLEDNSYGSVAGVAVLCPKWSGTNFAATTRPVLATVESWIDSVSSMLNSFLAEAGFTIPVAEGDVTRALDMFVNEEVTALVLGVNGSGRFGPTSKAVGKKGRYSLMLDDVKAFVEGNKAGFQRLGAARSQDLTSGVGFRDTDEGGDATSPIFQRGAFGNVFTDWDN